jgi:TnpA family transposase
VHTTGSLLIARLHANSRQSALAKAPHEYGRLVRTIFICRYVGEELRRRFVRTALGHCPAGKRP